MDYTDESQFYRSYLSAGEAVLWRGAPEKGHLFNGADVFTSFFGLFFLGFSLFWEWNAFKTGILFMMFWGIPFVAVGAYLVFGRFIHTAYLRNKTFYIITNQRLLIKKGRNISIYHANDIPPSTLRIHSNGNGTIFFRDTMYRAGKHRTIYFALENLKDPMRAQDALSTLKKGTR